LGGFDKSVAGIMQITSFFKALTIDCQILTDLQLLSCWPPFNDAGAQFVLGRIDYISLRSISNTAGIHDHQLQLAL
jgi:hypothetical protein